MIVRELPCSIDFSLLLTSVASSWWSSTSIRYVLFVYAILLCLIELHGFEIADDDCLYRVCNLWVSFVQNMLEFVNLFARPVDFVSMLEIDSDLFICVCFRCLVDTVSNWYCGHLWLRNTALTWFFIVCTCCYHLHGFTLILFWLWWSGYCLCTLVASLTCAHCCLSPGHSLVISYSFELCICLHCALSTLVSWCTCCLVAVMSYLVIVD